MLAHARTDEPHQGPSTGSEATEPVKCEQK